MFFPSVPSREWLVESVKRFGEVFDSPMGLGDREGKEVLHVSARIGFALAPEEGTSLDELLLRAEGRARSTGAGAHQLIFPAAATITLSVRKVT